MLKKIFTIFVIVILVLFAFFYCKKNKKPADPRKKLTFWSIQLKPIYEKQILNIIKEFESKHPEIKVVWIDVPIQEAQKRTLASVLSSNPADLINLNPEFSVVLAQKNALLFFDEKQVEQFHPNLLNKLKYGGKIYALPYYATSAVTIYNKELFSGCFEGDFPKTYDELFELAPDLKICASIAPFVSSINENDTLAKILNKYGIYSLKSKNDIEKTAKIYSILNKMYKNGYFPQDILTINHREVIEKYMSNQTLSVVAGSNFINMIKQNAPDIYSKSALSEQLSGKNGKYDISLMNLIIPKKAQNKELALEFALLLTNKENQLELAKITNVLPANKFALKDEFFKNCSADPVDLSRCISANQLNNIEDKSFGDKNKKEINEILNKTLEEILLDKSVDESKIKSKIEILSEKITLLQNKI